MTAKKNKDGEEGAWRDYLASIEEKPSGEKKKGIPFSERLRRLLSRIGLRRKAKGETELERQLEISAEEGKKIVEEEKRAEKAGEAVAKLLKEMPPAKPGGKEPLAIEEYLARIEEQRRLLEARQREKPAAVEAAEKIAEKPEKRKPEAKKVAVKAEKVEKEKAVPLMPKKVLFLPRLARKRKAEVGKKIALLPKARKAKKEKIAGKAIAEEMPAFIPVKGEALAKFLAERPSIARKPVKEIKKLSPEEIKKEVKLERIARKAAGWYGDVLRHKKAALSGWRLRKKLRLHQIKKNEKKGKLTKKEAMQKKALIAEDKGIRLRIDELDSKIRALRRVAERKKRESRIFEKKVRAAGVEIPKAEISPVERGRAKFKERTEMIDLVEAMRGVADEIATAAAKQTMAGVSWTDALTSDEQIQAQQKLIKSLETAFYKRRVDFNQFREKMFEYQSKLSEMKIKKRIADQRLAAMSPEMRAEIERRARPGFEGGPAGPGISPRAAKALEKMAEAQPKPEVSEKVAEAIKKLTEKEAERAAEKETEKKFAERTAEALQKIAEKLAIIQRPEQPAAERPAPAQQQEAGLGAAGRAAGPAGTGPIGPAPTPGRPGQKERPEPRHEEFEEEYVPPRKFGRKPVKVAREAGYGSIRRAIEKEEAKEEARIKERIIERVREKGPEKEFEAPRPKVSPILDRAIRDKAIASGVSRQQIDRIEEKLGELLEKYHIPDSALAMHISSLDSSRLIQDFQKLIGLIEAKREEAAAELIKPMPGFDIATGIISKKKEIIVGKEKEIRRARIETTFDMLLSLVQLKGVVALKEAAKELGMNKKEIQECAEILERNKLIELNYPPIGSVKLIYPGYLKWKEEEKKKAVKKKK